MIDAIRERYERIVLEHPVLVLLIAAVVTVYFASLVPRLHFSGSTERFFLNDDPEKAYFERSKKLFGNDQVVSIAMVVPEGETVYTKERFDKIRALTRQIAKVDGVEQTISLTNVPAIRAPLDPKTGEFRKVISVKRLVRKIPGAPREWEGLQRVVNENPLYLGNLVSKDGRAAAIIAFIKDFDEDPQKYKEIMADIKRVWMDKEWEEFVYVVGIPETRVEISKRMVSDLKVLVPLTFLLIFVSLVISYRRVRGVVLPLLAVSMTTLWAMGFMEAADIPITMVTMILPPLMLALGSSYAIHTMSEYMAEADPALSEKDIVKKSIERISLPVTVCGVTTMIGFASLMLNGIPAIQDLGKAAVAGIFFSVLIALFVSPSILVLLRRPKKVERPEGSPDVVERTLARLARFNIRRRRTVFALAILLVMVSIYGITKVEIETDFLSFFAEDDPVIEAVNKQTAHLAGTAPFNIVLEADRSNVFNHPAMLQRIEALQRWAEEEVPGIDTTLSMADYVKLLNRGFHRNKAEFYRIPDSARSVNQLLFLYSTSGSPEDYAAYITQDYSAANILIRSRLVGSTETNRSIKMIQEKAEELFAAPANQRLVIKSAAVQTPVPVKADEEEIAWGEETDGEIEEEISWGDEETIVGGGTAGDSEAEDGGTEGPPAEPTLAQMWDLPTPSEEEFAWPDVEVHVTGSIYLMNRSADAVSKGQVTGLLTALAAIFVVMALLFLSAKIGILAMLPNLFPIFLLFGIMGFTGITLNFSTSLIAAIALGIGVDDTIHYINRYNSEVRENPDQVESMVKSLMAMGKPMAYTSVALFFGFLILTLSDFVPIRQFGVLTAVTIMIALASNLVILPTLLISVRMVTLWDLLGLEIGKNPARYIKIFNGLTNNQARIAVLLAHVEQYEEGELIFHEDAPGDEMYVVLSGSISIFHEDYGKEIKVAKVGPGEAFGEMGLLRGTTRTAAARAIYRTRVLVVEDRDMKRLERHHPRIAAKIYSNLTRTIADRLQTTTEQLVTCELDE